MERFAISFDTSKTCLNYNEFVPNQVFTLPGGAYMSTHLDDDGSHRVSINLESLLGRKYKIVLNAKANTNRVDNNGYAPVSSKRSASTSYGRKKKKKIKLKVKKSRGSDRYSTSRIENNSIRYSSNNDNNDNNNNNNNNYNQVNNISKTNNQIRQIQQNDTSFIMKKLFDAKKCCAICHLSNENISEIHKCVSCGVEVHALCYGINAEDVSEENGWKCLPCSNNLKVIEDKKTNILNQVSDNAAIDTNTTIAITEMSKNKEKGLGKGSARNNNTALIKIQDKTVTTDDALKCVFCLKSGGAMKQTVENTWAHMSCALRIENCTFFDKKNMNLIGIVDEYGNKIERIGDFIHRQSFEHNAIVSDSTNDKEDEKLTVLDGTSNDNKSERNNVNQNKTRCNICNSCDGLKIKCAVVGCDEYFHASCLKPHNSLSFTLVKSGRVVMNTLCKFHFELAVEKTTVLPSNQYANSSSNGGFLYNGLSERFGSTSYNNNKNRTSITRKPPRSNGTKRKSSGSRKNRNPNIPKLFASVANRKHAKYKTDKKEFYKELNRFHPKQRNGSSVMDKPPVLAHIELDLYNFFILVLKCGGFDTAVEFEGTWSKIFKVLPNYSQTETSASYRLKRIYSKFLLNFQRYIIVNKTINTETYIGRTLKEYVQNDFEAALAANLDNQDDDDDDDDEDDDEESSSEEGESSDEEEESSSSESEEESSEEEVEESSESEAGSIEAGATNKNESQRNQFLPQLPPVPDDATNVNIDGFVFTELA